MRCKAAHTPCLPRGARTSNLTYVRVINKNSSMLSATRSQRINSIEIKYAYLLEDPTQSRCKSGDHKIRCQLAICAFIRDSKCCMIDGEAISCDSPNRSIICTNEEPAEDMVRFV